MTKIIIYALTLLPYLASSQTKFETEQWIVEKLNKYAEDYYYKVDYGNSSSSKNYNYKIENGNLVVEYTYETFNNFTISSYKSNYREEIPISEMKSFKIISDLTIYTYDQSIKIFINNTLSKLHRNYFSADINLDAEENLRSRLLKAFNHLITFYPRVKRKEVF